VPLGHDDSRDRSPAGRQSHGVPAGTQRVVLRRLKKSVIAAIGTRAASCRSSQCLAACSQISSVTAPGRSESRVAASASAGAARSASSKSGFSYQAAAVSSFPGLTPALAGDFDAGVDAGAAAAGLACAQVN
jgi:hypothetical protein